MAQTEQVQTDDQVEATPAAEATQAQVAEFAEVADGAGRPGQANLDILLDISMPVTINIGKTEVPFHKVLQLGPGSVLQLDKPVEQPAELYIQDVQFATGDIVVVDGCFAVRIREILGMQQAVAAAGENEKKENAKSVK